ncbi:Putative diheme cytochrome c-553 [hydrothermal vent metagenome]|uniref:Diheme cytochrome c-553 n=1 Tax=hydrothermal vent metagenome TaxID=652676 RepID=A0A3B1CH25_9ZZZZ
MKLYVKILAGFFLTFLIAMAGLAFIYTALPGIDPASKEQVVSSPRVIARGEYLVKNVMGCLGCHSERNWLLFSAPIKAGTTGQGGFVWKEDFGDVVAPNITPAALEDWTDGEIIRAIVSGVDKEGEPLFPIMPYQYYNRTSQQDINAVVAYLRTLKPIDNYAPKTKLEFPLNLIVRTMPIPYTPQDSPNKKDTIEYGEYLAMIGGCLDCHTPMKDGQRIRGMEYAGGFAFPVPSGGVVRSANITSDPETGLGYLTQDAFIGLFAQYRSPDALTPVAKGEFNTVMPWTVFARMTDEDLSAIYVYLKQIKPVENDVKIFTKQ